MLFRSKIREGPSPELVITSVEGCEHGIKVDDNLPGCAEDGSCWPGGYTEDAWGG